MSRKIAIAIFLLLSIKSVASKKDGIYFSFEEYKNNIPSLGFDIEQFVVNSKSSSYKLVLSESKIDEYLQNSNVPDSEMLKSRNIWCIVNNGALYVNHGEVVLGYPGSSGDMHFEGTNMIAFIKIIIDGHICLTGENKVFKIHGKSHSYPLSVSNLKKLIKDDVELFDRYRKIKKKEDEIIPYIKLYNERNPL